MQDPEPVVSLRDVTFFNDLHPTIRNACLDVFPGEFLAVIGKSGSGKSTLLKGIAGLLRCTGEVRRSGRMRMVFQRDLLLPWLTVQQNVALGATDTSASRTEVAQLLGELGIEELSNRYPWQVSGGERQRAAGARAFLSFPEIILMDEPFGSLDVLTRERMQDWLLDYWMKHRSAIIFVTHDIEEALMMADRVVTLSDGCLIGETEVPFPRPRQPDLRFTDRFIAMRRDLREQVHRAEGTHQPG